MAQSRLEKIGTIYTRVTGLLRRGAMKPEDKPIWYDVYEAFPPKLEPRYDRPASNEPIRDIFYKEDKVRAKFQKSLKQHEPITLVDTRRLTQTQQFIKIHEKLIAQGALDEEQVFETANELLAEQRQQTRQETETTSEINAFTGANDMSANFQEAFAEAKRKAEQSPTSSQTSASGINIKNLFDN